MKRLAIVFFLVMIAANAQAEPLLLLQDQLDEATKLTLAQAMVGEADWNAPDHVAIAFVLARRWPVYHERRPQVSFREYIALYSSPLRRNTGTRSAWVRSLPWAPITGPYAPHWDRVRTLVERWSQGLIKDPCPHAMHWGGAMDRPGEDMKPVSCGLTRNIFYGYRKPNRN